MTDDIKRVNMRMGQKLHDWFQQEASSLGVSTSALMIIAMNEYRKQNVAVNGLPDLNRMISEIKQAEVRNSNGESEQLAWTE